MIMRPRSWLAIFLASASIFISAFPFSIPRADASVATTVDTVNLPNGFAGGAPASPNSERPSPILRLAVTPSAAGTLTSVRVNFSGTGFTASDLKTFVGASSSTTGVILMRDGGTVGSPGPGDTYVELPSDTDWLPGTTSVVLTPSSTVNLSSGVTQYFFVYASLDASISNGDRIIASIPVGGIITSQGSGPAVAFTSNSYTADTVAPSILSFEGALGSPTTTVRFSEPVQSAEGSALSSGGNPLTYIHGGGMQTIGSIAHTLGQDVATVALSADVALLDLDGSPASIAADTMKIVDLAGNAMGTATTNLSSPVRITTGALPAMTAGTTYTQGSPLVTLGGSGGTAPYTYEIAEAGASSTLAGMGVRLMSGGEIVGTPTTTGSFAFPARIIDVGSVSSVRVYTLNIASVGGLIPGIVSVTPGGGPQSGSVTVSVVGANTSFGGSTSADVLMPIGAFGTNGVTISGVSAANATHLSFTAAISADASSGPRDLRVSTGGQVVTLPNAFSVFAGAGGGLQLLLPVSDATGVPIPPVFSFSQTGESGALTYRVKVKTVFEASDATAPVWDYAFTKTTSESTSHCGSTQCNVRYGVGNYRVITPPTSLAANTDYYWQVLTYATSVAAVANGVAPLESTTPRHFRTTDSVTDTTPPGIMHRPVFRARESSTLNLYAKVFDNIATQSTSPALTVKVLYCQGSGCSSMSEAMCTGAGAGFYYCSIPSSVAGIGAAGTITRYYLRANDGSNTSYSRQADGSPFQLTAAAVGSGTISGSVLDGDGACPVSVQGARVMADGTSYSATTDASCNFSLGSLPAGSYDLLAFADGYGERRAEGVSLETTGLSLRLLSGVVGGVGGDTTRPAVRMSCPFNGSRNMPGGDSNFKVCVGFSKSMNQTTVGAAGNLTVRELNPADGSSTDITTTKGSWTYYPSAPGLAGVPNEANMAVWSFSGSNTFGDDKTIAVVIGSGVTDVSGNAIQGNQSDGSYAISFTTGRAFSAESGFGAGTFGSGAFIPPRVVGSTPAPGAFGIPRNTRIVLNFSEAMADDAGAYLLRNCLKVFPVSDTGETSIVSSASLDSSKRIATITVPTLAAGTQYRLRVLGACRASSGLTLGPPGSGATQVMYSADFRTGTTSDATAPTITGSFPNTGATSVPVGTGVVGVSFSLDIDPSTITTETVYLSIGSTRVNGSVEYRPLERRAVFSPRTALSPETAYTLNVTTDVTALNGTALAVAAARTFTTGAADTVTPQIRFMNADDHAISITFSESMNAASLLDTVNWPRSVLNPDVYDVIKYGASGFNAGSAGTVVALTGGRFSYDPTENTVLIEGVNLAAASGQELYVSLDVSGANVAKDVSGNTLNTSFANTRTPVKASSSTGGALGPGAMNTNAFATGGFTPTNISTSTFSTFGQVEARPSVPGTSASSKYFLRIPLSRQIPSGGKVMVTFPSGFSTAGAKQDVMSPSRQDLNGPGTGAVTFKCATNVAGGKSCAGAANDDDTSTAQGGLADDGIVVGDRTVTAYLNGATNAAGYDFLMLDIDGITNSSVPLDFSTSGYTVDIKTFNGTTLLESLTSRPFYLQSIGSNTLGGTLTMPLNDQSCSVNVYLNSPTGGTQTAVAAFSGGTTASYSFSNVASGDAFISTDRAITCGSGGSAKEYVGKNIPDRVTVSGAVTHNFSLSSATTGGVGVTVTIVGAPIGERLDVFGGSQANFVVRQVTIASDPQSVTLQLPDGFQGFVGVGPQVQPGTSGPPIAPSYVLPRPKEVKVSGSGCTVEGAVGCTVSFSLTAASKTIKGIVKDASDRLMANVEVFAYSPGGFGTRGQTSSDGTFSLAVIEGTYTVGANINGVQSNEVPVRVSADATNYLFINGATTGISAAAALAANVLKIAKPECTISGTVTDGTNVVQSAGVSARRTDGPGFSNVMTDSSGSYTLYVGCTGTWEVRVFNPGYGEMTAQTVIMAGASQSGISFSPTLVGTFYTVSGTVSIGGTGLQGAIVRVQNATTFNEAITDSTGAYSVRVPTGLGYTARAFIPGSGDTPPLVSFAVESSNVTGKNFAVGASNSITFVFSGNVNDGFVDLVSSDGRSSHADIHGGTTSTLSLPDGTYEVRIGMPGIEIGRSAVAGRAGTAYVGGTGILTVNGNEVLDVTLPTLRTVSGSVAAGATAIPDAWVEMIETTSGRALGTKADGSGAFSLAVPDGTYKVNVMKPGYLAEATTLVVSGDLAGQALAVSTASLTISGQVLVSSTGVANAFVRAERQGGGFSATQTDAEGNYSLSVTAGNWRLVAVANGYREVALSGQVAVGASSVTGKNITLSAASAFTVAEPASQPISTSSGGTIEDTDAGVRLVVGPNALTTDGSNAIISTTQTTNVPITPGAFPLPGFEFSAQGEDGNAINNFNDAIAIDVSYTQVELATLTAPDGSSIDLADANNFQMASYDPTTGAWDLQATTRTCQDADGNPISNPASLAECATFVVSSVAEHFSLYAPVIPTDPSAPTTPAGLAATASGASAVNLSWTQVAGADSYDIYRSTTEGGTYARLGSEPTVSSGNTVTYSDTTISSGSTYYYKISALDGSAESAASTAVSVSVSASNAGGGGGGYSNYIAPTIPSTAATATVRAVPSPVPVPAPNVTFLDGLSSVQPSAPLEVAQTPVSTAVLPASPQTVTVTKGDAKAFGANLTAEDAARVASFIENGSSKETVALGSGERRALLRDAYDTLGKAPSNADLERLARGEIAKARNMDKERAQLPRVRSTFRTIYGRDPNFKNAEENLAWNTLMYRIRFPRDLKEEKQGIVAFRQTFRKVPTDPFQWAVVRVLGYVR